MVSTTFPQTEQSNSPVYRWNGPVRLASSWFTWCQSLCHLHPLSWPLSSRLDELKNRGPSCRRHSALILARGGPALCSHWPLFSRKLSHFTESLKPFCSWLFQRPEPVCSCKFVIIHWISPGWLGICLLIVSSLSNLLLRKRLSSENNQLSHCRSGPRKGSSSARAHDPMQGGALARGGAGWSLQLPLPTCQPHFHQPEEADCPWHLGSKGL